MTDPFADLERELLGAHARDLKPRRHLRAAPRLVAFAVAAAAAVTFAVMVWQGTATEPERAAAPPTGCAERRSAVVVDEPAPAAIAERLSILSRGKPSEVALGGFARQAARVYGAPVALPRSGGYDVAAVAADIVPRDRIQPEVCISQEATEPGACLQLSNADGGLSACFTVTELMEGEAFIDAGGDVIGLAPDTAREAAAGGAVALVENNLFTLPGGPETDVVFRAPDGEGAGGGG